MSRHCCTGYGKTGASPRAQLPEAVAEVWIRNAAPVSPLGHRRWLERFKAAVEESGGPIVRTVEVRREGVPVAPAYEHVTDPPSEPIEIWRGAALDSSCGMSWSVYRDCALSFAQSRADFHGRVTGLFRAVVPPHGVLALFGDWREQEVVVNPYVVARSRVLVSEVAASVESRERRERLRRMFGASAAP